MRLSFAANCPVAIFLYLLLLDSMVYHLQRSIGGKDQSLHGLGQYNNHRHLRPFHVIAKALPPPSIPLFNLSLSTSVQVAMSSSRTLVSSRHSHNAARLQFPLLPPQLAELYRPGQMLQHEDALPKLPVPPLQQTLKKYLAAVEVSLFSPFLNFFTFSDTNVN